MDAETKVISESEFFDEKWYKDRYLSKGGFAHFIHPAKHYLKTGWIKSLNPSERFNTAVYLDLNPDVRESNINPLLHYELFGKAEGRFYRYDEALLDPSVPMAQNIKHGEWPEYLKKLCDKIGNDVLEIASRVVTGADFGHLFEKANYTGFDIYDGPNVDVVGDAHHLSSYFDKKFDLIFSSAVFEHLAMPWIAANEIIKLLKPGGYVFIETHYCYGSHQRPWHFFQFSEQALKILFPDAHGIRCLEAGISNPLVARFSDKAFIHLKNKYIHGMYCHSEFLGQKVREVEDFSYGNLKLNEIVGETKYPAPQK